MNQTKKLTQGAMMLAIVGALILIDRMTAYWFTEIIVLMMPVVIIMYAAMHTFKDGVMLSVGLTIISFLLGNFRIIYLIYVPVGILTGLSYAWGIKRGMDKRRLLYTAIITYTIGELIATFIVYPLMGFPVSQMIEEYRLAMGQAGSFTGIDYTEIFSMAGIDFAKLIVVIYVMSTIVMGAMEGVLIHLLSVFLLKRFKIKDLGSTNIFDMRPSPKLAYTGLLMTSTLFFAKNINNEMFYYIAIVVGILGAMILMYYGYIFVILFGIIVLKRNIGGIFVLLCFIIPALMFTLIILGFLYGSGPLRSYIEQKAAMAK
ncbi:MAG: DUF2232 domain-containing protein [Erysipelotrichaceae bacterium]|nr:DUF2232 domain-containing protein [Erysipelotrichaceae bacterium]